MAEKLYGKLAQNPARYFDYKIVPGGTKICRTKPVRNKETKKYNCPDCAKPIEDHEWKLAGEYENHEIHKRESLWRWRFNYGVEWQSKDIYKNVATGASITGFTRAHLLRAMHTIGMQHVIYCDTDGIVCTQDAQWSALPISPALGDWKIEDQNAPIGHFAGKKLYGIELSTGKHKCASKGARLVFSDYEKLVNGETVVWENDAPSFSIDGKSKFIVRDIRATARTQ